jgi:hypothetical protein
MSDTSRHSLYAVAEVTYGTTPATPALKTIRHVGCTLGLVKGSMLSEELRADRQIVDFRHGTRQVGGEISGELSYGAYDDFLEAVLGGTWASDVLKAGTTRRSFSIMRHFSDIADADKSRHVFKGVELNTLSLGFTAGDDARVNMGFGCIGRDIELLTAAITDSTFPAVTTGKMMDCISGTISEGGGAIALVTECSLSLENGIAPRFVVGSGLTIRPSIGRSTLTGNVTAFFETSALLEKFINETATSLQFTLQDPAGNEYDFEIPNIVYTGGQIDTSGQGPHLVTLPFQAIYNTADASQIVVTRTPVA